MAINVSYSAINWENRPSTASPINATNLNKMDTELGNAISTLNGLSKSDIGLGNVDNTSDTNKPISNATQTALNNKVDKIVGKGLSTNDYTSAEKTKLAGIEANANKTIVDSILSSSSTNPVQNKVVNEFKLDKGETAVSAKGIILATPVREEDPYVYRKTPVASSLNAKMHSIIGGSVAWNQLYNYASGSDNEINGITFDKTENGVWLISGTSTAVAFWRVNSATYNIDFLQGHKYYIKGCPSGGSNSSYRIDVRDTSGIIPNFIEYGNGLVYSCGADTKGYIVIRIDTGITISNPIKFIPQLYDLTQMFGSEIANYVYTLEQAESGSGIAWLKSYGFFTEDYYAYDTGSIESVNVSGKKVTGKNLSVGIEDGTWQYVYQSKTSSETRARGKEVLEVHPSQTYTASCKALEGKTIQIVVHFYTGLGSNKFIQELSWTNLPVSFVTPNNCKYITYVLRTSQQNSEPIRFIDEFQLELGETATSYSPYEETSIYPLDSSKTLRGLFKLATDKLTVDGDIYNSDGSLIRKYGVIDLGTLNWTQGSGSYWYTATGVIPNGTNASIIQPILCDKYVADTQNNVSQSVNDKTVAQITTGRIAICDSSVTSSSDITGILIYQLATTTTESANPFIENEKVGTEEFIDYGVSQNTRDVAIPVGTETDYYQGMELPPLPTASGNHNLQYNPSTGFSWS